MSIKSNNPLVSVAVMTYNSEKYVLETLESVKAQTHPNIHLLVSDDASTDDTLAVVRGWISKPENSKRFNSINIITVKVNTGLPANCNRALNEVKTEWVKLLAGDDILLPNYLEDNLKYIGKHPDVKAVFSQVKVYNNTFEEKNFCRNSPKDFPNNIMDPEFTANEQYKLLLISDRITYTPSFFFNRQVVLEVGGYDETFRLIEDYPMWLKLTRNGVRLHYFHTPTVGYRMHSNAINNTGDDALFKPSVINNYTVRKTYAHPYLPKMIGADETWKYQVSLIFNRFGWKKNNSFMRGLYSLLTIYLNPFTYLSAINSKFKRHI